MSSPPPYRRYRQGLGADGWTRYTTQPPSFMHGDALPAVDGQHHVDDVSGVDEEYAPDIPVHLHHHPAHSRRLQPVPPTFVKSSGTYDDLGRLRLDPEVPSASRQDENERTRGEDLWKEVGWDGAAGGDADGKDSPVQGSKPSSPVSPPASPPRRQGTASPSHDRPAHPQSSRSRPPSPSPRPPQTISVPRSQWFIRRALLTRARNDLLTRSEAESHGSSGEEADGGNANGMGTPVDAASGSGGSKPMSRASSIASLIDLPPPRPSATTGGGPAGRESEGGVGWKPPAWYAIRPDNVGYQMLLRGGWEGGGLGGAGRGGKERQSHEIEIKTEDEPNERRAVKPRTKERSGATAQEAIEIGSSGSDSDADDYKISGPSPAGPSSQLAFAPADPPATTTGRTAPVATVLKTNLYGIGHHPRSSSSGIRKRVTHTDAELRAMKRGKVVGGDEMEKGRKRLLRQEKRNKEERKRLRAALDA